MRRSVKIIGCLVTLCLVIPALGLWLWGVGLPYLEALGYVPYIQEAIDTQCPELSIVVGVQGYSGDPGPNWSSPEVFCANYTNFSGVWECQCRETR